MTLLADVNSTAEKNQADQPATEDVTVETSTSFDVSDKFLGAGDGASCSAKPVLSHDVKDLEVRVRISSQDKVISLSHLTKLEYTSHQVLTICQVFVPGKLKPVP